MVRWGLPDINTESFDTVYNFPGGQIWILTYLVREETRHLFLRVRIHAELTHVSLFCLPGGDFLSEVRFEMVLHLVEFPQVC